MNAESILGKYKEKLKKGEKVIIPNGNGTYKYLFLKNDGLLYTSYTDGTKVQTIELGLAERLLKSAVDNEWREHSTKNQITDFLNS